MNIRVYGSWKVFNHSYLISIEGWGGVNTTTFLIECAHKYICVMVRGESWVDQRVPRAYIHNVALLL
jgi:hypothetical protein